MISHPNGSGQSALCSRHTHTIDAKASATGFVRWRPPCAVSKAGAVQRLPRATRRGAMPALEKRSISPLKFKLLIFQQL